MKKAFFDCSCGNERVEKVWSKVIRGHTKTCGKCNYKHTEYWQNTKFGKLMMKEPGGYTLGSNKHVEWACDCGNIHSAMVNAVTCGNTKSCGRCNVVTLSTEKSKYGKLLPKESVSIHSSSNKPIIWTCDCGNETTMSMIDANRGHKTSCGKCNQKDIDFWKNNKFGRLLMKSPGEYHLYSNKKVEWVCDCGEVIEITVINVTKNRQKSCGKCYRKIQKWYANNKEILKGLKTPITPDQVPDGGVLIHNTVYKIRDKVAAICPVCGREYLPMWESVKSGKSLSCGCSTHRISSGNLSIHSFLSDIGLNVQLEYELNGLNYDLYVDSKKLLIEYNGLKWHSFEKSKKLDIRKYQNALENDYGYIMIYEDEWNKKQDIMKNILINRVNLSSHISLRPNVCSIVPVDVTTADSFYDKFHYIGKSKSKVNYGAYFCDELISCISFRHPVRQTISQQWELSRMASDPRFRVHGIWSKLLRVFCSDFSPSSIVSYSDNRFFNGRVYGNLGFVFDGFVPPDYYWCKNTSRHHKSGLRKTKEERKTGKTEVELRRDQGYRQIWDVGKKRWIMSL